MSTKNNARLRRARSTRSRVAKLGVPRLSIFRSGRHIYAQVFSPKGDKVLASASTVQKTVREGLKSCSNMDAAAVVGKKVAEAALSAGVSAVAFDRSGYKYHGRVKAIADAAREAGLQF